jgi:alpha-tubulin suppressor-like RCC1 family protein
MNVANLVIELKSKITANTLDQQMISRAIEQLQLGVVYTVNTFDELPVASENTGKLYYIPFDGLYFSNGNTWPVIAGPGFNVIDDVIWSWGSNFNGRLGDDSTINRSSPVSVVGGFTDWCQISAGSHSLAIKTNGTVWSWGNNGEGRLGTNETISRSSPVSVVGGFTDWCQVSAGSSHSLGVRSNGSAWAWGLGALGRLGNNANTNRSSPVSVVGGFTDWCQVSAGCFHSLGLRTNGTVWAWGENLCGQLGQNSTISRSSPVSVVGGFTNWCQVSAGDIHSVGVRTNGTAWAWGQGTCGRIGDNATLTRFSPVSVVGGFTDWCQVSAGYRHSLGVRTNGTAWGWGNNQDTYLGVLGNGLSGNRSSPVSVVGGFTDWCQVSAGRTHSLGLRTNGTVWAWGDGSNGRLGENSTIRRSSPVSVVGGFTDWCQVSANYQSLGLRRCAAYLIQCTF